MNEQQTTSVEVLNRLYEAEMHTLLPRLNDLTLAISRRQPQVASLLRTLADESRQHREWLIETIELHHGSVWPATLDIHSAGLHYTSSTAILPRVQANLDQLVAAYNEAAGQRTLTPAALELVRRICRRYEAARESLRQAAPPPVSPAV